MRSPKRAVQSPKRTAHSITKTATVSNTTLRFGTDEARRTTMSQPKGNVYIHGPPLILADPPQRHRRVQRSLLLKAGTLMLVGIFLACQHKWDRQPGDSRLAVGSLKGYCFAVELGERKAVEGFVIGGSLIAQDTDGDGLTEQERLITVRAPVHTGHVTAQAAIVGQLVEFPAHRHFARIGARVGKQRLAVVGRDDRTRQHEGLVEERLQRGDACAGDRTVSLRVRRMLRVCFRKSSRKQVRAVLGERLVNRLRV